MALATASTAGFCGSSQAVLQGSLQLSGSSSGRLSMAKANRMPLSARQGLTVRAQQQSLADTEMTSRRAMLGLVAAGIASGSLVQTVLAESKAPLVGTPVALSGVQRPVKIAGIPGSISESAMSKQLIRAAIKIAATIPGLEVEYIDIDSLPVFNIDLVKDGRYPPVVETFMKHVRAADGILFASPEYNYSVSAPLKNAIDWASMETSVLGDKTAAIVSTGWDLGGSRSQYHLRQIGIRPDIYFINKPELFINVTPPVLDDKGNITDTNIEKEFRDLLVSLQKFTIRLRPCA
ncbi:NADPH:quinone oxidoreductase [Sesamum alatum]|uniref:NAD(P)H dehydrogenase (quinone) n=1 Tax=Sesamum alatum TaxID=300844 RepID=A0AAE1Y0B4_9LAMI|nr:NADPH:quinone oxidoreductase [Sesamum alatum]